MMPNRFIKWRNMKTGRIHVIWISPRFGIEISRASGNVGATAKLEAIRQGLAQASKVGA